jgi:hypothetical protein
MPHPSVETLERIETFTKFLIITNSGRGAVEQ